tara:strand:- start:984 stop:1085 length:102 start_codon:yes stop_codon:yes gene_type:complete
MLQWKKSKSSKERVTVMSQKLKAKSDIDVDGEA